MMKKLLIASALVLGACEDQLDSTGLRLGDSTAEHVSGTFERDGHRIRFDSRVTADEQHLVVWSASGAELFRSDATPEGGYASSVLEGALWTTITTRGLELLAGDREAFLHATVPGIEVVGDIAAVHAEMMRSAEYALLPYLSYELGQQGLTGNVSAATLPIHFLAQRAADDLEIDPRASYDGAGESGLLNDVADDPGGGGGGGGGGTTCNAGGCHPGMSDCTGMCANDCLGMCGKGCSCWEWVCGDCGWHPACQEHDDVCDRCGFWDPWACVQCYVDPAHFVIRYGC